MLNPFPDLLMFQFFAPTLLRMAAGVALIYLAYMQYQRRDEIMHLDLPFVGKNSWWYKVSIAFNAVLAIMFIVGYYTQIAALLAIVGLLKGLWLNKHHPHVVILPNSSVILLIVMCASLLLTGAGALAFDLPL